MKVPFLNKRKTAEFKKYIAELELTTTANANHFASKTDGHVFFSRLFPLFALLRGLSDPRYARDRTRDTVLSELRSQGRKEDFVRAIVHFNGAQPFLKEFREGERRSTFSGYFEELFSDSLLLLNCYYGCNYRGAFIALRCMLEDLYRHLYYLDHPQEFWRDNSSDSDSSRGPTARDLREYLRTTRYLSVFKELTVDFTAKAKPNEDDLFGVNEALYSRCSRSVHASTWNSMNGFQVNGDMKPNLDQGTQVQDVARQFVELAIIALCAAHADSFLAMSEYERSMVLSAFSGKRLGALRRVLKL